MLEVANGLLTNGRVDSYKCKHKPGLVLCIKHSNWHRSLSITPRTDLKILQIKYQDTLSFNLYDVFRNVAYRGTGDGIAISPNQY